MDAQAILANLKVLTLDLVNGRRDRADTVALLHQRIAENEIYTLDQSIDQRDLITEVFVSLDNLTNEEFAPSMLEMQYFADCFEGRRIFYQPEVRKFAVGRPDESHSV